jgi:hypothetical protein
MFLPQERRPGSCLSQFAANQCLNRSDPAHQGLTRGTNVHGYSFAVPCRCIPILVHRRFGVNGRVFRPLIKFPKVSTGQPGRWKATGHVKLPGGGASIRTGIRRRVKRAHGFGIRDSLLHLSGLRIRQTRVRQSRECMAERSPHGPVFVLGKGRTIPDTGGNQ